MAVEIPNGNEQFFGLSGPLFESTHFSYFSDLKNMIFYVFWVAARIFSNIGLGHWKTLRVSAAVYAAKKDHSVINNAMTWDNNDNNTSMISMAP